MLTQAVQTMNAVMAGVRDGLKGGLYVTLIAGQVVAPVVWALPDQSGYEAGNAPVSEIEISGNDMIIAQDNSRILLNWDSFNIAAGESVSFIQDLNQLAINQVNGGSLSEIFGTLNADANIMLINPAGVAIYNGAIVNVGSLIVSGMTLDETALEPGAINSDATGPFDFSFDEASGGLVTVQDGVSLTAGNLILLGKQVTVDSDIDVGSGLFGAGAAGSAVVTFDDDGLVGFSLNSDLTSVLSSDAQVAINGAVNAGRVILTTQQAAAAVNNSINITDTITAENISISGDRILLGGSVASVEDAATASVSQNLEISAEESLTISGASTSITAANHSVTAEALDVSAASSTFNQLDTTSTGAVTAGGLTVGGLSSVSASSAALTTNANATLVGGSNNEISTNAINFTGVASADLSSQSLAGSSGIDNFNLNGGALTANNIAITNAASAINASGENDTLTTDAASVSLTGSNESVTVGAYTFSDIEDVALSSGAINGSVTDDIFTVTGSNAVTVDGMAFTGVSSVDGGASKYGDSVFTTGTTSLVSSQMNALSTFGINFTGIENADLNGQSLAGSTGTDTFTLTNAGLTANNIVITDSAASVDTNGGNDVFAGATGAWELTGANGELKGTNASEFTFTDVAGANLSGQSLAGSTGTDTFTLTNAGLTANSIVITDSAASVDTNGGNDVFAGATGAWELTGTNGELKGTNASEFTFTEVTNADLSGQSLAGSSGTDTFTLTNAGLTANSIVITDSAASVDTNGGNDVFAGATGAWELTGANGELKGTNASEFTFTDVAGANLSGQSLAGSTGTDTFTLTNAGLTANSIVITDSAASVDTNGGNDVFAGATGAWELTGTNGELKGTNASEFTFTEVTNADLSGQSLAGSAGVDNFTLNGSALTANNIAITNAASAINAGGESDTLTTDAASVSLTGENESVTAGAYTFSDIEDVALSSGAINANASDDTFTVTANNALRTAGIDFTGVASVAAGSGSETNGDTVDTTDTVSLVDSVMNALITFGINFTGVENADLNGQSLAGSTGVDNFTLNGSALTANNIAITSAASAINAGGENDTLATDAASVSLTGENESVTAGAYTFSDIEEVSLSSGAINANAGDDTFTVTANNALRTAGIDFTGVASVAAGSGSETSGDTVDTTDAVSLVDSVMNALTTFGINFTGVENADLNGQSLEGSAGVDTFTLNGSALTANSIAVTNAASAIDAGGGSDSISTDLSAVALTGGDGELIVGAYTMSDIESADVNGAVLSGSDNADSFIVNGLNLTANGVVINGAASAIDAGSSGTGSDTVSSQESSVKVSGQSGKITTANYEFSDIEAFDGSNLTLTGTDGNDIFNIQDGEVTLDGSSTVFTGVSEIDALDGDDTLNTHGVAATLLESAGIGILNAIEALGISFLQLEVVNLGGGELSGSAGADTFAVNGATLTANGVSVTGAGNQIDAGGGNDAVDLSDSVATLTGTDGQFGTSAYTFSAVETVAMTDGSLTGTSGNDEFNLTGDNAVTATNIGFTGVISISGGAGDQDSVTTQNAALVGDGSSGTGKANALSTQGISVTGIEVADLQGGVLSGSDQADTFALESGELSANGITFSNAASTIDMGSGSDSLSSDETQVTLSSGLKELNAGGYTFQDLDSANLNSNELVGTAGDDEFTLGNSNGLLTSNGISFSGVAGVDAGEGTNDQVTTNNGDASLVASGGTATDNSLLSRGITFSGIDTANLGSGTLSGSSEADAFVVNGTTLTANQIQVTSSSTSVIDGAGGDDTLSVDGGNATLTGTSQQIIAGGKTFGSVASASLNSNILSGSSAADNFDLTGTTLTANDIEISGADSSIDMGDGQDTLTTDVANVDLTGADKELSAGGYIFESIEAAELASANITANDSDDTFDVTGANSLSTAGMNFSGVATVAAGSGSEVNGDTVETTDGVSLIDSLANALSTFGITFSGIENADLNGNALSGSTGADSFTLTGAALSANGISISDAALTIDASGGQDILTTDSSSVSLTGTDGELAAGTYTFADIESAGLSSAAVNGSAADDTFTVTGTNTMTASGIDFTGVASVDAGSGGEISGDTVVTSSDVSLVDSVMNALATFGISFTGIENADLNGSSLSGSAGVDVFTLNGSALTANQIAISDAASGINASGGDDSLSSDVANVSLTGTDESVTAGIYTFNDIEEVALSSGAISANAGDDIFTVTAANALTTAGIDFTGVTSVGAGSETDGDTVDTSGDVSLVDSVANALTTFGISFTDVENADLNGNSLNGSAGIDAFTLNGSALTANDIAIANAATTINAGDGRDTLSTNETQVSLTGNDEELVAGSYTFADLETIELTAGTVVGNASDDNFEVLGTNYMTVARMEFTGVNQVVGGTGSETDGDYVSTEFDTSLVADTDFAISTGGILFTEVESAELEGATLSGSAGDDAFEVNGFELIANKVNIADVNTQIDAGLGNDSVSATGEEISLDGTDGSMSTAQFQFTSVESSDLTGSVLNGSDASDSFVIKGESSLDMNGIAFTGVTEVNAGGGNDQLDTDGNNASLLSDVGTAVENALIALGIIFRDIEEVDLGGATLTGSDAADSFEATGTSLTANGMAFTDVAADINAGNGADTLVTSDSTVTLAGVSEGINTSSFNFTEIESAALSGGTLNGSTAADVFTITGDNAISASGMTITGVANIVGGSGNDQVVTTSDGAALISDSGVAISNALAANDMRFDGIENVNLNAGNLQGSDAAESYAINGVSQSFAVNSMTFTNADSVDGGAGSDIITTPSSTTATLDGSGVLISGVKFDDIETVSLSSGSLVGTGDADTFSLSSAVNQVTSGSILFTGVSSVNGAGGADSVAMSSAGSATLGSSGSGFTASLINFSSVETLNLAGGVLTGAAANNEEFALSTSANSLTVNGLTVNNVATVNADSSDTISGSTGQDSFVVKSDNTVAVNGITFDGPLNLKGGSGADTLTSEIDTARWVINGVGDSLNKVGDFVFSQFESLVNAVGDLDLATSLQLIFSGESASFGGGAMTLGFNGDNDVSVFSTFGSGAQAQAFGDNTSAAIRGSVTADELVILSFGDIELMTNVNLLSVTSVDGQSINASIVQDGDLVIREISIENGVLILDSLVSGTGTITAETVNTVDVSALSAHIGSGKSGVSGAGQWASIGSDGEQLTFEVQIQLDLTAISFVTPFFPTISPVTVNKEGNETDSLISSQNSAVIIIGGISDVTQLNPAVFEALSPFIADANAVSGSSSHTGTDVPSTLDTEQLAVLLAAYEPTAAGAAEDYSVDGTSEEEGEEEKAEQEFVDDGQGDISVSLSPDNEVVGLVRNYRFRNGDSLWSLAQRFLGTGFAWNKLLEQNPAIDNPSAIADGTVIKVITTVDEEKAAQIQALIDSGVGVKDGANIILPEQYRDQLELR
ncbi:filamentous hemagglutinin N-terminal domain-containing protein [uncultured Thalassolituus sp.]|uniref:filamentous hemagglutinin N-terminal domain-containing protein n=2 Tax=uncultured Thalassolituus sp. TaxID=285273 RepID=UPI002629A103|nr:filamentous hemagglutinin N-terminal domain-containing protein [uncultured Thalassolituus sp.]